jgi:haloalkane dehalogenase
MMTDELPPWLKVLYPFSGDVFETPEGRLHYVDEGDGPAVVMLHGNPTWSFFYRDLILALRGECRCLALDHLGCGLSDKPQEAEYTLAGHIRRAVQWLESLGIDRFHLVVHDWGGAIGFGVAKEMPDRISGISILNTAAFRFPTAPMRIGLCRIPLLGTLAVRGGNAFVEGATRMTTVKPLSEAVKNGYRYPYGSWADRVAIDAFVKDIPLSKSHRSWKTLVGIEESLSTWATRPVQIIWGMRDWCFHEPILQEWTEWLPDAAVHRINDAGHFLLEDAGEQIIPLIREAVEV